MTRARHLSKPEVIDEFPGVCGSVYLNTAAEGLFLRSNGAALQRYAELKQTGARGRDGCLAAEWRARRDAPWGQAAGYRLSRQHCARARR